MKKVVTVLSIIIVFIFVVGCLDYKAYEVPKEDSDLLSEIAQIEEELSLVNSEEKSSLDQELEELEKLLDEEIEETEVEEEVVLPKLNDELDEEPKENNDDVQVIEVDENKLIKLNVKVADPDEDTVTYTFTRPLNTKGEWKTNYGDAGEYLVTLTATDGTHKTEKKIRIVVNRVNVPPVIEKLSDIQVKEGETVNLDPKVNDPNNDPVSVTLSEPLKSGTFVTDHTSAGEYLIKVVASDGELEAEETFKLVILDVNEFPVINNVKDLKVKEGETVKIEPEVTDLDGDKITLTISEPVGQDGVWETTYTDHGEYFVTVMANDGKDTVTKRVKVIVEDVNMPPEFIEVTLAVN